MSERDRWIPTVAVSNTVPPRICERCLRSIFGVFYVCYGKGPGEVLCAECRP